MQTGQRNFTALPVINISGLYGDTLAQRQSVADQLGAAARDVGFFYIIGHGIDPALIAGLREASRVLFAQQMEWKMRYYIGNAWGHKGYVPEGEEVYSKGRPDHKEAFDIGFEVADDHPLVRAGTPLIGNNKWPDLPGFKAAVSSYYEAVFALGRTLFRGFALALGQPEDAFDALVTCPPSKLRLIHYPVDSEAVDAPGIGAHTDYECFTLLLSDQPGLEVMNDQGVWVDAPPYRAAGEEAFVINIGDMLEVMTAGAFAATSHRVRKVQHERYSFPLFFACDYHTRIRPLPQFAVATASAATGYNELSIGEHMYSQAQQTYSYLKRKVEAGELALPAGALKPGSFGYTRPKAPLGN
ncbi:isopenicillin N synthase-like dioxygenase [Herbaspirillum sp. Sphag1AN]|uniref:isopenicillin N synthase family dioxygenase n=1 Tax=unclassified Herbaspirillum TaxID=2624150 RepID=UPI00161DA389|nr:MULTISPECIES: isopenicillin N synthase family oxygenase [unclassified Herbaspirillum]MBB3214796.1 isopenicillin N synthase-like dioxygenase [Herbaspirillum sp. Sphag1AN]MBB3247983.1 isopenicillin N synthase-like dioxygenase [Herbaspirillum sp. Sphag64]